MRKSQSPQPLPLPSFLRRDEGLSPLIPNATLGSRFALLWRPWVHPKPWTRGWLQPLPCQPRAQPEGGQWFGSGHHPPGWRGARRKVAVPFAWAAVTEMRFNLQTWLEEKLVKAFSKRLSACGWRGNSLLDSVFTL